MRNPKLSDSNALSTGSTERLAVEALPDPPRAARPARPAPRNVETLPVPNADMLRQRAAALDAQEGAQQHTAATLAARAQTIHAANGTLTAIARVLAVRLQLLLSLLGAFALALGAMNWQSTAGLLVLVAFCTLTILPLVALEWLGRPRGG